MELRHELVVSAFGGFSCKGSEGPFLRNVEAILPVTVTKLKPVAEGSADVRIVGKYGLRPSAGFVTATTRLARTPTTFLTVTLAEETKPVDALIAGKRLHKATVVFLIVRVTRNDEAAEQPCSGRRVLRKS